MKISRRTMLAGSAAAVTAPVLATVLAHREPGRPAIRLAAAQTGAQTAASVSFSLQNNTLSDTVYAFVTGQALAFARAGLGIGCQALTLKIVPLGNNRLSFVVDRRS